MTKTCVLWDERYTMHDMGPYHVESPERLMAIKEVVSGDGVGKELTRHDPRPATKEELALIHDEKYIQRIADAKGLENVMLDADTISCRHTWDTALLAAGGTIGLAEKVCKRDVKNAFAFVRPPGHHAERSHAMGFCIFNNIAIASEYLIRNKLAQKIAIIDFDVHHGNGTQNAFYRRDDVFFISIHRTPFYPGSGMKDETGEGEGRGFTLNLPIHVSSGDDDYKNIFDTHIIPAVIKYKPDFIAVSAGFDAHVRDPLGGMRVTTAGFRWMAKHISALAGECSDGKLMYVLEGGYDLSALRDSSEVVLETLVES